MSKCYWNSNLPHKDSILNLLFDPDCILHSYVLEFDDFLAPLVIVDRFPRLIDLILADVHPHDAVKVIGEGEGAQSGAATDVDGQRFPRWRPKQDIYYVMQIKEDSLLLQ